MVKKKVPTIPYRRKREQRTDYNKRLHYLKGKNPRLVVRKSLQHMLLQIVEYQPSGDKILFQVKSSDLQKYGMPAVNGNIPCAYLTGLLIGVKAKKAGIAKITPDLGLQITQHGSRLFAALKGVQDAGIEVPMDEVCLPSQDRLEGKHIATNTATQYTRYKAQEYPTLVDTVKQKILQS
jgi:large subunit ribosomal protein L18